MDNIISVVCKIVKNKKKLSIYSNHAKKTLKSLPCPDSESIIAASMLCSLERKERLEKIRQIPKNILGFSTDVMITMVKISTFSESLLIKYKNHYLIPRYICILEESYEILKKTTGYEYIDNTIEKKYGLELEKYIDTSNTFLQARYIDNILSNFGSINIDNWISRLEEIISKCPKIKEEISIRCGRIIECNISIGFSSIPHIYVVNHPLREDRKEKIIKRLEKNKLEFTIVTGETPNSEKVIEFTKDSENINLNPDIKMLQFACYYSHLKAIRNFYESGESTGIIFEDDVMLRKNFNNMIIGLMYILPKNYTLCMLETTNNKEKKLYNNERTIVYSQIDKFNSYGALGYIISREYAEIALEKYDKPLTEVKDRLSRNRIYSENILMNSGGYICHPPLVIEEPNKSNISININVENHINNRRRYFAKYGFENYE